MGVIPLEAVRTEKASHLVSNNLVQNLETEWRLVHQAILYRQSLTKDHILGLELLKTSSYNPFLV